MSEKRRLAYYLHTHWDREWYWSFAAYRTQLLEVVARTVEMLEDGRLDNFMLDGQTCMLDDVRELKPDLIKRVEKLVRQGKLSIGPWYVLADQMLVGGESLIRNLSFGIKAAREIGAVSMVGYCPDTFGHSADLPRILSGFGIDNAVVWRGVPRLPEAPLFYWRSADGSEVMANFLAKGYYLTAFSEDVDAEKLASYMLGFLGLELKPSYICEKDEPGLNYHKGLRWALLPVGGDHMAPPADFKERLAAAKKVIKSRVTEPLASIERDTFVPPGKIEIKSFALEEYLKEARQAVSTGLEPLPLIVGELRDNAAASQHEWAYMLPGVLSTRLYLKRENRLAERYLARVVEPLRTMAALFGVLDYPDVQIAELWRLLLKNQPHDSICGCSVDTVHREMMTRFDALQDSGRILVRQTHEALGAKFGAAINSSRSSDATRPLRLGLGFVDLLEPTPYNNLALAIFNGCGTALSLPVKVRLAVTGDGPLPGNIQVASRQSVREAFLPLSGIPDFKNIDMVEGYVAPSASDGSHGVVPPLGLCVAPLDGAQAAPEAGSEVMKGRASLVHLRKSNACDGYYLNNEFFSIHFNSRGDLIVKTQAEAPISYKLGHHITDVGDGGDTYNFDPLADDEPIEAELVGVRAGLNGPLVASFIAEYQIKIPAGLSGHKQISRPGEPDGAFPVGDFRRSRDLLKHKIETEITLKAGSPVVGFETTFENRSQDHRMEVVFAVGEKLDETYSENHHGLLRRAVPAESKLHPRVARRFMVPFGNEAPLDRYPCQRFFTAAGQIFFNTGLPEYGAAGSKVSMTILRAVGKLSRARLRTRGGGAGPNIDTPQANCLGPVKVNYGWAPFDREGQNWRSDCYRLADIYEEPLTAMVLPLGEASSPALGTASAVSVDNAAVQVMAFYMEGRSCLLRLLNVEGQEVSAQLTINDSLLGLMNRGVLWKLSLKDLGGRETVRIFDNEYVAPRQFALRLKPYQLITVEMCFSS